MGFRHRENRGRRDLFGSRIGVPVLALAALIIIAAPVTFAVQTFNETNDKGHNDLDHNDTDQNDTSEVVSVNGTVTKFLYDDHELNDTDDSNHSKMRVSAFVIDNSTIVTFGPWWYWMYNGTNITDVVHVGDQVNVTGELEDENGTAVLEAWHIDNITTGAELTIKEEGRPPWAGGPKALGIDPWPLSEEDD